MNIAHILSNPIVGGTETLVVNLAKAQIRAGISCTILNFWRDSDVGRLAASEAVPYVELGGFSNRFISPVALATCWREIKRRQIDIVCAHGFRVQMALRFLFRLHRKRLGLIGVLHGVETWRKGRHIWPDHLTSHWVDGFVGISQEVCAVWQVREGISESRMVCIPNGIDTSRFRRDAAGWPSRRDLGLPETGSLVLTVANYRAEKGHAFLVEAIILIARQRTDLQFCWCGKGEDEEQLKALVVARGVADRVHFLGHVRDVRPLLAHAELFVLPSREEGLPLALLEAMSMETVCIATDVGGVREVLRDGVDGTLVRYLDVDACAQAILRHHDNPSLRRTHGTSARQRVVDQFDINGIARRYENYFQELLVSGEKVSG